MGLAVAEALLSGPAEIAIVGPDDDPRTADLLRAALHVAPPGAVFALGYRRSAPRRARDPAARRPSPGLWRAGGLRVPRLHVPGPGHHPGRGARRDPALSGNTSEGRSHDWTCRPCLVICGGSVRLTGLARRIARMTRHGGWRRVLPAGVGALAVLGALIGVLVAVLSGAPDSDLAAQGPPGLPAARPSAGNAPVLAGMPLTLGAGVRPLPDSSVPAVSAAGQRRPAVAPLRRTRPGGPAHRRAVHAARRPAHRRVAAAGDGRGRAHRSGQDAGQRQRHRGRGR